MPNWHNSKPQPAAFGQIDLETGEKTYNLHQGQSSVLRSTARFTAAIAGTGGGKTAIGPLWIAQRIAKIQEKIESGERDIVQDPIMGMVIAPTYKVLARATAPTLVRSFAGTDLEGRYVPTSNLYYLPNGMGEIWVLSSDNPGGLEGGQFDFVWMDEGGQMKYDAWIAIQGRTGLKEAPVLITTTPYGLNWLYHKVYKQSLKNDPNYACFAWSSIENPRYPKAEYERAKREMSRSRGAQRYDGKFVKAAGLVYPDLDGCLRDPDTITIPEHAVLYGGMDFGWNDPFCGLCAAKWIVTDEKGTRDVLYVWYERYKRLTLMSDHAEALPPAVTWFADPSRPDSAKELRMAGHTVKKAYNDIVVGIDAVTSRIYSDRLWISGDCRAVIAEAAEYAYPEEDDETVGEIPVDKFNHAMDALRYLVAGVDRRKIAMNDRQTADSEDESDVDADFEEAAA